MSGSVRVIGVGLVLAGLACIADAPALEAQERPRIAVIPFDNQTGWWTRQLGPTAASQLTVGLVNSGAFTVLERRQVESVFEEWHLGQSGAVTPDKAVEIGNLLGAEYVVTGEFTHFNISERGGRVNIGGRRVGANESRAESAMNVRVVSVTTGEIVAASQAEGNEVLGRGLDTRVLQTTSRTRFNETVADQALGPAVEKIVADLVASRDRIVSTGPALPTIPVITGLGDDGSVYIDLGENAGMAVGTRFHVLRVVDVIRDRDGNVLDQVTDRVGTIEVTRVLSQSSISTVIEGEADVDDKLEPAGGS